MNMRTAKLIYFSPTGTTRKVLEGIAKGFQPARVDHLDLTPPDATAGNIEEPDDVLAIIGSPVYAGRVPVDVIARLQRVKGNNTPAVIVVVYGNRAYDDALVELRDVAAQRGFKPVAAAAFIGEHSFSTGLTPIAVGRPDREDLRKTEEFGKRIQASVRMLKSPEALASLQVPGNIPFKERGGLSGVVPATDERVCAKCGNCSSVCPAAAVTVNDTVLTDPRLCIRCCACVKACSSGARAMEDPRIRQIAQNLSTNCRARKEPELYL